MKSIIFFAVIFGINYSSLADSGVDMSGCYGYHIEDYDDNHNIYYHLQTLLEVPTEMVGELKKNYEHSASQFVAPSGSKRPIHFKDGKFQLNVGNFDPKVVTIDQQGDSLKVKRQVKVGNSNIDMDIEVEVINSSDGFPSQMIFSTTENTFCGSFDNQKPCVVKELTKVEYDFEEVNGVKHCRLKSKSVDTIVDNKREYKKKVYDSKICNDIKSVIYPKLMQYRKTCTDAANNFEKTITSTFDKYNISMKKNNHKVEISSDRIDKYMRLVNEQWATCFYSGEKNILDAKLSAQNQAPKSDDSDNSSVEQ